MARRAGRAARSGRRDHQLRAGRAARARAARDLRDAGACRGRRDLQGRLPLVALAAGRRRALACSVARTRARAGRRGPCADRARLPRSCLGHCACRAGMVDPSGARRPRCARRGSRLGDDRRAAGDEHARERPAPPRRRQVAADAAAGDLRLRAHGLARPTRAGTARRRRGGEAQARRRGHHGRRRRPLGVAPARDVGGRSDGARPRRVSFRRCPCASRSSPTSTRTCTR